MTIITSSYYSQTSNTKKVLPKNPQSTDIVGQWIPLYDKDSSGKKLPIKTNEIDTLIFLKNSTYLNKEAGSTAKGTWSINTKDKIINYKNSSFTMTLNGKVENIKLNDSWDRYDKISKDTLTLIIYLEETLNPKYNIRYFVKK